MSTLEHKALEIVQENPSISTCALCRALNNRPRYYCGDKKCFANGRKRSHKGSWKDRPIMKALCRYPLSTLRGSMRRLRSRGLMITRRELKRDGDNNRGYDFMSVSYSTLVLCYGGLLR